MFFCCALGVGLMVSAIFPTSSSVSEFQRGQIEAFLTMVDQHQPPLISGESERAALRALVEQVAVARARPTKFKPLALLPFVRPDEANLNRRADELGARAGQAMMDRDGPKYFETLIEFYAELSGYPGEHAKRVLKSRMARFVLPLAPILVTFTGMFMIAQPEICGVQPGDVSGYALTGLGLLGIAGVAPVCITKAGRDWADGVGDVTTDQRRGVDRIEARFWSVVRRVTGEEVSAQSVLGPNWGATPCEGYLSQCTGEGCTAG